MYGCWLGFLLGLPKRYYNGGSRYPSRIKAYLEGQGDLISRLGFRV